MVNLYLGPAGDFLWRNTGGLAKYWIYGGGRSPTGMSMSTSTKVGGGGGVALVGNGGQNFVRLAGISGTLAVALGAYGAHVFARKSVPEELKQVYETANRYHLIHTLALLGVPLTRRPLLTGTLIAVGMLIFCGSCYVHAFTANKEIRKVTPYGGVLLMIGWLSMVL